MINLQKIRRYLGTIKQTLWVYFYDMKGFLKYSMVQNPYKTQQRLLGLIVARYHVVEKGLTMPNMRPGFGFENIMSLIDLCQIYTKKFDVSESLFISAIESLKEYKDVHEKLSFQLNQELESKLSDLFSQHSLRLSGCVQKPLTKETFIGESQSNFLKFAHSRCSVRNYTDEEISPLEIRQVVELAQTAPTACNRQPIRVHVVGKDKLNAVLSLQNGNRGFGDRANKLLIVSVDRSSYLNALEHNCVYVDGGIYVMNLLYALHYYHIGACTLNWSVTPDTDQELKRLLAIDKTEAVVALIAIGHVPQEFKVAASHRVNVSSIMVMHE